MESRALISVIIPTRNRLDFLREAVASVAAQSFRDWELIVVDDCSEDGTREWLASLEDRRIRVLRLEQHKERSAARNAGLAAARGEYVLFLDDDDELLDGALARLFDPLHRQPAAICAIGALAHRDARGSWSRAGHPRRGFSRTIWPDLLFDWMPQVGQALCRRSFVVKAGAWKETLSVGEDYEFWLRLGRLGPAVLIPQAVLAYRVHPGQTPIAGWFARRAMVRREAVEHFGRDEKRKAERSVRAFRLKSRAWRALARGHAAQALLWWWRAVLSAPWLLLSPIARGLLIRPGLFSAANLLLGPRGSEKLRGAKRACVRVFHGKQRTPASKLLSAKAARSPQGQP